ncbi:hypothetical protein BGZ63DRAFT_321758, partial [Mariannaea sp. PMI_226]
PNPKLETYCHDAKECYGRIVNRLQGASSVPLSADEQKASKIAADCVEAADKLTDIVAKYSLSPEKRGLQARMSAFGKGVRMLWRHKEVDALEKDLERHQSLLEGQLLGCIYGLNKTSQDYMERNFNQLDSGVQQVLFQVSERNNALATLLHDYMQDLKAHVSETNDQIHNITTSHIAAESELVRSHVSSSTKQIRDDISRSKAESREDDMLSRLLGSLKFEEMNARRNTISENWPQTFEWIFKGSVGNDFTISSDWSESAFSSTGEYQSNKSIKAEPLNITFVSWLESEDKMYWVSGKPASGKSTLMKFILNHPQTLTHLRQWQADVHLLSHFFWKPGTSLQSNLKGWLCSCLHQILLHQQELVLGLGKNNPDIANKDSHFDWSVKELLDTLLFTLCTSSCSYCIFLDGFDEVVEENKSLNPFDFLDQLKNRMVHESLARAESLSKDLRQSLTYEISTKAQGVFLWALLVLHSLKRGIDGEDSFEELMLRLKQLPTELDQLYKDMWERLGDDTKIYQQTASLYFNLLISAKDLQPRFRSLVLLTAGSSPNISDDLFNENVDFIEKRLCERCEITARNIRLRCTGILEISSTRRQGLELEVSDPIMAQIETHVGFIHRTAVDFLVDTEYGRTILDACGMTQVEIWER